MQIKLKSKLNLDVVKKYLVEGREPQTARRELLSKVEVHSGPLSRVSKAVDCEVSLVVVVAF